MENIESSASDNKKQPVEEIIGSDYDAIIAGTGPGGATVGRELSKKGKKVLFLEWGPNLSITGSLWQGIRTMLTPGKGLLFTKQLLAMGRGINTGGSTTQYFATWFPVPIEYFKKYGVDLSSAAEYMKKELPVAALKDEMIGPMANRIMESASDLGYDWRKLEKIMYQDKWRPEFGFGHYGDPHGVKWSSRMFVEESLEKGSQLIDKAKVKKVIIENGTAIGVEFSNKNKNYSVYAPKIIISAGGIGTPLILRESGIEEAGNDFFFDPLVGVRGIVKDFTATLREIPMSCGMHLEEDGIVITDMAFTPSMMYLFAAQLGRIDTLFLNRRTMQIMVKVKDELAGNVGKYGIVDKKLTTQDKAKISKGVDIAKKILKNLKAKNIYSTWYLAAHPGGTCKIGDIVNADLQTRFTNLFVCDCSVIPDEWGMPPSSTIVSLGKYLADRLSK